MNQYIRLAGVTYEGRQQIIARLSLDDSIYLERDYYNAYDSNAIGVFNEYGESIGWIPREVAAWLAPKMDADEKYGVEMNRILGGDGLSYGVEIILKAPEIMKKENAEWLQQQEKILALINRPQTKEESEQAFKMLNDSMRESREKHILEGNFEDLHILLNNRWLTLDSIKSFAEHCFNTGRFENCYKSLLTLKILAEQYGNWEIINFCNENISIFLSYGYDQPLPEPYIENYPQSVENDDESYPDLDRIYNSNPRTLLEILYGEIENANFEGRAAALFTLGELHFLNQNIPETIELYSQAISENPNKALYWGYKAQVLNRNEVHPLLSTRFLMKAIELDPENPRWHFLQAILLVKISQTEGIEGLMQQAVYEAHLALDLLRPEQEGLRKAILTLMGD
jgi:tetratricopeptide (TPR) repeat protein